MRHDLTLLQRNETPHRVSRSQSLPLVTVIFAVAMEHPAFRIAKSQTGIPTLAARRLRTRIGLELPALSFSRSSLDTKAATVFSRQLMRTGSISWSETSPTVRLTSHSLSPSLRVEMVGPFSRQRTSNKAARRTKESSTGLSALGSIARKGVSRALSHNRIASVPT